MKAEDVIGTWQLTSYQLKDNFGNLVFPFGEHAQGFLIYNKSGYVTAQIMKPGREKYDGKSLFDGNDKVLAESARGYISYVARYTVNVADNTVTHDIILSLNPGLIGNSQRRFVNMSEDLSTLDIISEIDGAKLSWRKVLNAHEEY